MKISILNFFLILVLAILLSYQFYHFNTLSENNNSNLHNLTQRVNTELSTIYVNIAHLQAPKKPESLDNLGLQLEYLIREASIHLTLTRDLKGTLQVLDLADNLLQDETDPKLIAFRKAIIQDKNALQNVNMPDISGLWLEISALLEQVSNLPTRGLPRKSPEEKNEPSNEETASWKQNLHASLEELKNLVQIKRHSKAIEPILSETEQILAKERLRLLLEQLRFAVLQTDTVVFSTTNKEAQLFLETYFEPENKEVQTIHNQLKSMENIQLRPTVPELSHTLNYIKSLR